MKKRLRNIFLICLGIIMSLPLTVFGKPIKSVDIPIVTNEEMLIQITSDINDPLPETHTKTINGTGSFTISYTEPDVYVYQIKQIIPATANPELDEYDITVYNVYVSLIYDETNILRETIVANPARTTEKPNSIAFHNKHKLELPKIKVLKIDKDTKEPLKGAELTIFDEEDNEIYKWITTDDYYICTLEPGKYILVETEVPDGYLRANDIHFEVDEHGLVNLDELIMEDKKIEEEVIPTPTLTPEPTPTKTPNPTPTPSKQVNPQPTTPPTTAINPPSQPPTNTPATAETTIVKTGDISNIILWLMLLILSGGLVLIVWRKNKKSNK